MPMASSTSSFLQNDDDHFLLDMDSINGKDFNYRQGNNKMKKHFALGMLIIFFFVFLFSVYLCLYV